VQSPKEKLSSIPLAESAKLRVGQQVAAIGNPFGLSGSMSSGIISGLGRLLPSGGGQSAGSAFSIPDVIQTDAPINPGNSGGPLLNMRGEAIGMNSAIFSTTGQSSGVGFAIPSDTINKIVPSLITKGTFQHPWLGISGRDMTPGIAEALGLKEPRGFLVIDVVSGSPAEKAGIKGGNKQTVIDGVPISLGGDLILGIDNKTVRKIDDILVYLQREKTVGDVLNLSVMREGRPLNVTVTLAARPALQESP
jgi:S1-C subfamily serine protease